MGGENPYIAKPEIRQPTRKFRVTFQPMDLTIEVDPEKTPDAQDGLPGSILQIALDAGAEIDHACGGVCACSTCHCLVQTGLETCSEPIEEEEDMIDSAAGVRPNSRLACQAVPDGTADLVVEIPGWNRNLAKEGHAPQGD
ncbi:MAG: 2Fe-2S iron-sulfur cluster binding domain-containing protein [bacterium]|nr:2Fe-2S iron-sulfur cluster binding domain-containing protein [bacterium]